MSFAILRQSTALDVLIGPFVDSGDGDAEETALTINRADVLLSKNGQTAVQKTDVTAAAHDADGFYNCELDATDTDTVGQLVLYVHVAGALAVRHDFQVIEEATYDFLWVAGATPIADIETQVDDALATFFTTAATLVNLIWDEAMVASTGAPAITGSMRAFMEWWATLSRNVINQTATTTTVRNDADDGDISTSTVSDDATTFVRGEFST